MADLGAIGVPLPGAHGAIVASRAVRRAGNAAADNSGWLKVFVNAAGVPQEGVMVGVFFRENAMLIQRAITGADGSALFHGLDRTSLPEQYFAMALDPAKASPYRYTIVKDHLTAGPPP